MKNILNHSRLMATGKVVCWACGSGKFQLFRCEDQIITKEIKERGNSEIVVKIKRVKSKDYVCVRCRFLGSKKPPVENVSIKKA